MANKICAHNLTTAQHAFGAVLYQVYGGDGTLCVDTSFVLLVSFSFIALPCSGGAQYVLHLRNVLALPSIDL